MSNSKKRGKGTKKKKKAGSFADLLAPGLRSMFVNHYLTSHSVWFLPNPPMKFPFPPFGGKSGPLKWSGPPGNPYIYPGAVIPVDPGWEAKYINSFMARFDDALMKTLPPGVPLDEDIFDVILQHWKLLWDMYQQVEDETATNYAVDIVVDDFANKFDFLFMEITWRRIQKTKS